MMQFINYAYAQGGGIFGSPETEIANTATQTAGSGPFNIVFQLLTILLGIAGLIAVVFLIYSSFQFAASQGDQNRVELSKNSMFAAIIAVVVIILAFVVVRFLANIST